MAHCLRSRRLAGQPGIARDEAKLVRRGDQNACRASCAAAWRRVSQPSYTAQPSDGPTYTICESSAVAASPGNLFDCSAGAGPGLAGSGFGCRGWAWLGRVWRWLFGEFFLRLGDRRLGRVGGSRLTRGHRQAKRPRGQADKHIRHSRNRHHRHPLELNCRAGCRRNVSVDIVHFENCGCQAGTRCRDQANCNRSAGTFSARRRAA